MGSFKFFKSEMSCINENKKCLVLNGSSVSSSVIYYPPKMNIVTRSYCREATREKSFIEKLKILKNIKMEKLKEYLKLIKIQISKLYSHWPQIQLGIYSLLIFICIFTVSYCSFELNTSRQSRLDHILDNSTSGFHIRSKLNYSEIFSTFISIFITVLTIYY